MATAATQHTPIRLLACLQRATPVAVLALVGRLAKEKRARGRFGEFSVTDLIDIGLLAFPTLC